MHIKYVQKHSLFKLTYRHFYDSCRFNLDLRQLSFIHICMKRNIKPSAAETAILNILWDKQPCSVKTVHEILSKEKDVGYTTTAKQMQRLFDKGMITREPGEGKSHLYSAIVSETETKSQLFDRFVENAFGNSVSELVMHALGNERASDQEIEAIRDFIEKLDRK